MKLVIIHHHFRPGGVRRVIELGATHLAAYSAEPIRTVVLAGGETPDPGWMRAFRQRLPGTRVTVFTEPAFGYASELRWSGPQLEQRVRAGLDRLWSECGRSVALFWAHNLGLGRNLYLSRELGLECDAFGTPLVAHHHDWWFDNRWHHFAALNEPGFRRLPAVARAILPDSPHICHVAINAADAAVLERHFPGRAGWLPNPVERSRPPNVALAATTRQWLRALLGDDAPVWLLPCRLLRRKHVAEAVLLARWLRPEAWLVTTGGPSSAEEQPYADALAGAAAAGGWRVRFGVLHGDEAGKPSVPELQAASEAVLLTSLHEGFGLPHLEAAAVQRPLIARELPQVAPDLRRFGFRFPQAYREVLVDPSLFDWPAERQRQRERFTTWQRLMPRTASELVGKPALLATGADGQPVAFSRLTLAAQLEVLAQPAETSWERCSPLNPFLAEWRQRALTGRLRVSSWPASASRWLGAAAYARRFLELVPDGWGGRSRRPAGEAAQQTLLRHKLKAENLYPLLWSTEP